jgi:hypothetical protein
MGKDMTVYHGNWSDLKSVRSDGWHVPKRAEVIFAKYDQDGYEGSAILVYKLDGKYYTCEGSHCSCYGIDESWSPEEYELPVLIAALEKRKGSAWCAPDEKDLKTILRRLRRRR